MAKKLLSGSSNTSDSSDSSDSEAGGASIAPNFQVNEEYAKRFEHNKKREELARLEEKLGKDNNRKRKRAQDDDDNAASESSTSTSEDEDEEGEYATAALDNEIFATLNAIKSKDPRIYKNSTSFYTDFDESAPPQASEKKDKPMYLRDYHRENLLNRPKSQDEDTEQEPLSYNQQQDQLKQSIVSEMHAAAAGSGSDSDQEGGLLVRKSKREPTAGKGSTVTLDVDTADRDPETFLSNFMAARAWLPTERAEMHPFESDDEEDEKRAEEFEEAYNMRFEDPEKANEKLRSYARDTAGKLSVRREDKNSRKKKREAEKAANEAAKQQLREEKARLKKLRMEQVEEKVKIIKRAAGLKTTDLKPEDWAQFIDDDWDDSKWEQEMEKRFGDHYYAEKEEFSETPEDGQAEDQRSKKKSKKPKKPKFDNDIDIKDIVPDFEDGDEHAPYFSLSDEENADSSQKRRKKSKKQARIDRQNESKQERRIIEQLVDDELKTELDHALPALSRAKSAGFRYRETSPQTFGLTSRDILLADDGALNQYAGLKKLATWRDEARKQKDRKHLGKKARLRKWRLDTFGDEEGYENKDLASQAQSHGAVENGSSDDEQGGVHIREGGKKKKGRRRKKAKTEPEDVAIEA